MTDTGNKVGRLLRATREAQKGADGKVLSVAELCRRAKWPTKSQDPAHARAVEYALWEAGKRAMPPKKARLVALALGRPPHFFVQELAEELLEAQVHPPEMTRVVVGLQTYARSMSAESWAALRATAPAKSGDK